jgi:hypothetical protein
MPQLRSVFVTFEQHIHTIATRVVHNVSIRAPKKVCNNSSHFQVCTSVMILVRIIK